MHHQDARDAQAIVTHLFQLLEDLRWDRLVHPVQFIDTEQHANEAKQAGRLQTQSIPGNQRIVSALEIGAPLL